MHKISKLTNGITLITIPVKGTKATTVLALFPVGSRYENKKLSGASHFVEHMMFKGTSKRPTAFDISRDLEAAGAIYNAFTYKDYTGYYVKIDSAKQDIAFDVVADMLWNSKFDAAEIEKEKGVIVEELRMYEDNPTMAVDMLFDRILFGDHPLGWDVGGTVETVKAITRDELFNYYQSHYIPHAMVLAVAGDVNAKNFRKFLRYFEKERKIEPHYDVERYEKLVWPKNQFGLEARVAVKEKKLDQAHLILGFPGLSYNDKRRHAAAVLLTILGGGMSSRLFVEVREKRGLAYMIHAASGVHRDVGSVHVQAGLDPARLEEALKVIRTELIKISTAPVTMQELADAKSNITGRMALAFEDSSAQAEWFAKQFWFMPKIETYEEMVKNIKVVKSKDVLDLSKVLFAWDKMRLAAIGPISKSAAIQMVKE